MSAGLVRTVARSMRESDRREIFAVRRDRDPDRLAKAIVGAPLGCVVATLRAPYAPVAVVAAAPSLEQPRLWGVGLFATERWPEVALKTARWIKRELMPALYELGALRAECHSLADHHEAHRLLRWLGATAEAVVPMFGNDGETFIRFAWRRDDDVFLRYAERRAAA